MERIKKQYTLKVCMPNISYFSLAYLPLTMLYSFIWYELALYIRQILCNAIPMQDKQVGLHIVPYRNMVKGLKRLYTRGLEECGMIGVGGGESPRGKAPPAVSVYCNYLTDKIYTKFAFFWSQND